MKPEVLLGKVVYNIIIIGGVLGITKTCSKKKVKTLLYCENFSLSACGTTHNHGHRYPHLYGNTRQTAKQL